MIFSYRSAVGAIIGGIIDLFVFFIYNVVSAPVSSRFEY